LAVGSWQLAVGSWQLAVGSWQLNFKNIQNYWQLFLKILTHCKLKNCLLITLFCQLFF